MLQIEADNKIKLGEEFLLSYLMMEENFGSWKILQVLVVYDNIYKELWLF